MAAWHRALVFTNDLVPTSHLLTYIDDYKKSKLPNFCSWYLLARIVPGVQVDGKTIWADAAKEVHTEDVAGGVASSFKLGPVQLSFEMFPLMVGRESKDLDGAAIYTFKTNPPNPGSFQMRRRRGGTTG